LAEHLETTKAVASAAKRADLRVAWRVDATAVLWVGDSAGMRAGEWVALRADMKVAKWAALWVGMLVGSMVVYWADCLAVRLVAARGL
jgi:hypothetical protein